MHIGKRLKVIRSLRGLTQAQVSEGIVSASHYSNIEGGRYRPPDETFSLLAERLSVPSPYFTSYPIDDLEVTELLRVYEDLIESESYNLAKSFIKKNDKKVAYISSLQQELYFNILRSLHYYKEEDFISFSKHYSEKVAPYIEHESLPALLQERCHYITAHFYYLNRNYKDSIHHYLSSLQLNDNQLAHGKLHFNIALACFRQHRYTESLFHAQKSKDHHLNTHNWRMAAECYNLLAVLYKVSSDFDTAEKYINKGLHILKEDAEKTHVKLLHNHALVYKEQNKLVKALTTIDKCLSLKTSLGSNDLFISYRAKLAILLELKDSPAMMYTIELARHTSKSELEDVQLQVLEGRMFFLLKRFSEYETLINKSITYYHKHEYWKCLKDITEELAVYYEDKKQYKKAYKYSKLCILSITTMYKELI